MDAHCIALIVFVSVFQSDDDLRIGGQGDLCVSRGDP